jgi:6-pyruvoyltetrahydropterin/6-carboxytetrahydropterin synthase
MTHVTIGRRYDFEAAHYLPRVADGHKCKRLHGHSYVLEVRVTGPVQESGHEEGMVVDFGLLDAAGASLRARIDHTPLHESFHPNPTVENMAPMAWAHFRDALDKHPIGASCHLRIVLHEGPRSSCTYPPEPV